MSTLYQAPVGCGACGATSMVQVADSLSVERMPSARQDVLQRSLFSFACTCGRWITAVHPFLYVDFERGLWVQVVAEQDRPSFAELEVGVTAAYEAAFDTSIYPRVVGALGAMVRPRLVFGYEELREKVIAADAGLDDVVVELLKLDILAVDPDLLLGGVQVLALEAVDDAQLLFAAYRASERVGEVTIDRTAHDHLLPRRAVLAGQRPLLFAGPYVNIARYRFTAENEYSAESIG